MVVSPESITTDKSQCAPVRSKDDRNMQQSPSSERSGMNKDRGLRRNLGRFITDTQQTIDSHLTLFRAGLIVTLAVAAVTSIKLSGVFKRLNYVEEIPFETRPEHILHSKSIEKNESNLLAVRLFGVQVDESAEEWILSNLLSTHRYMTVELLRRINLEGSKSVAICNIALRRPPLRRDLAYELVTRGYAECISENLESYDSVFAISSLAQKLRKLQAAEKHAQAMQYGIWKEWQDANLSDRFLSAGKRVTTKGFYKLIESIRR
ncbi:Staphylococcal nuclease (SNase-like), OB-fold [Plasmopara halstedii]|uniref:Staphylococcal nuclease (SNase-like), OB-fold n=1 Tax=Plasmopara halstedii TaxID=4781 RepID=A0A0P1AKG9_PLAHL|nr:Staphylococcal nuclease (SNase-like), OB-fold [Plasmopara halstedii]CEG41749.1 Staphylococcal nuclease (SNase-like), OB-fold [Plasmopara halstedii]|eukprot:XP_024578118.1 Staphylococcal nuclease (SNase-like), OB-fold [Plasmopara halstedii]